MSGLVKAECRKGCLGLGANLVNHPFDLSETGVRLVLKAAVKRGEEAEVVLSACFGRSVERRATTVWCVPVEGGYLAGLRYQSLIPYADLQGQAAPPRVLR